MTQSIKHIFIQEPLVRGLSFIEAYERLPVAFEVQDLAARWIGPVIDIGHEQWISDMGQAGWGYLEGCGWSDLLPSDEEMLTSTGKLSKVWEKGLYAAACRLAERARYSGPESDPSVWLSWICFAMSKPNAYITSLTTA